MAEWVKEGTGFSFDLHLTNLSAVEFGTLVWLLSLPEGQFLRLGLGKPLGFGSVQARLAGWRVNTGAEWVKAIPGGEPPSADPATAMARFVEVINSANPDLLKAFTVSAAGFADLTLHYPPPQGPPTAPGNDEGGKHFQWFVANERTGRDETGLQLSLPDLIGDPSLPIRPSRERRQHHLFAQVRLALPFSWSASFLRLPSPFGRAGAFRGVSRTESAR